MIVEVSVSDHVTVGSDRRQSHDSAATLIIVRKFKLTYSFLTRERVPYLEMSDDVQCPMPRAVFLERHIVRNSSSWPPPAAGIIKDLGAAVSAVTNMVRICSPHAASDTVLALPC